MHGAVPEGGLVCLAAAGGVLLLLAIAAVLNYNGLVSARNTIFDSWAGIDTELKRRYDLIPNLVETVKGYAKHELEVLERVVEARSRAVASTGSAGSQAVDENALVQALRQIFVLSEGYPQLKADANFRRLQDELVNTEDRIQAARRFYNGNVREYNNRCQAFPSNIIAGLFNFKPAEFFEVEAAIVREPAKVGFPPPTAL
jgi:LemA protein